jgi:Rrf2 family protein
MKISSKTMGYALVAAGYIAQHSQEGAVVASHISEQYSISLLYLFKVLGKLVTANILRSKRGHGGGFSLTRPAKDITILEIIEAVDGPMLHNLQLTKHTNNELFILKMEKVCQSATEEAQKLYSKAKLSEILK